ncbi:hypothetical protein N7478_003468 [Penicillium angulare]|uniref:uncharacterized protein n=1 Tax=Penicillium angulare TaxID=116970 RepID=UPI002541140E|nr:uncharacterized protein N7478_003468 [Penicillium angulare]KAJ5287782.1 hypothetical protein N7478_003468 [Penicillium angulare]
MNPLKLSKHTDYSNGWRVDRAKSCLRQYDKAGNQQSHPVLFDYISSLPPQQKLSEAIEIRHPRRRRGIYSPFKPVKIEYLAASVKESIRVGMGIPGRLPRVVPENLSRPIIVDGKVVAPGVFAGPKLRHVA